MKKKFKKIIDWSYKKNGAEIVVFIIGFMFIAIPIFSSIKIIFEDSISAGYSIAYYIIGGIIILVSLVILMSNFNREVYYEEI